MLPAATEPAGGSVPGGDVPARVLEALADGDRAALQRLLHPDRHWTVDGTTTTNGGPTFDTAALGAGSHTVSAKAYDNASTDLVKLRTGVCPQAVTGRYCHGTSWPRSEQTVSWTVTKP